MKYIKLYESFEAEQFIYCYDANQLICVENYLIKNKSLLYTPYNNSSLIVDAVEKQKTDMIDLFIKYGVVITDTDMRYSYRKANILKTLLDAGGNPNITTVNGNTLLISALLINNDSFTILLNHPSTDIKMTNGNNVLSYAIRRSVYKTIQLLDHGFTIVELITEFDNQTTTTKSEIMKNSILNRLEEKRPDLYKKYEKVLKRKDFNL